MIGAVDVDVSGPAVDVRSPVDALFQAVQCQDARQDKVAILQHLVIDGNRRKRLNVFDVTRDREPLCQGGEALVSRPRLQRQPALVRTIG